MKILNLYAGIGGNRKLWPDGHDITVVEMNEKIAGIYHDFFPNDEVIVGDAHKYLLDHYKEFDFIWSSPPCPTHSRFNFLNNHKTGKVKYPDMSLYQEIILLQTWFKGKYCIENVISYYEPLIKCQKKNNHYFWTNFYISKTLTKSRGIRGKCKKERERNTGYDLKNYKLNKGFEKKILNNCTEPKLGLHIWNCAFKNIQMEML